MADHDESNPLLSLGFTELEAGIYTLLLEQSPSTGYRVAQTLGKPAANTYKAIESLERKGAVIVDEGEHRLCRPVPPKDLLRQLHRRHRQALGRAEEMLSDLHRGTRDDRVYRLRSTDQVFDRARGMLAKAREVVLVDAFPESLGPLEEPLRRVARRGTRVALKVYGPTTIPGAMVVLKRNGEEIRRRWPGVWLNLVTDGAEYLVALLSRDGGTVIQAIWTECPYLAWVHQSAFSSEIIATALEEKILAGASPSELKQLLNRLTPLKTPRARGYRSIRRELDRTEATARKEKAWTPGP